MNIRLHLETNLARKYLLIYLIVFQQISRIYKYSTVLPSKSCWTIQNIRVIISVTVSLRQKQNDRMMLEEETKKKVNYNRITVTVIYNISNVFFIKLRKIKQNLNAMYKCLPLYMNMNTHTHKYGNLRPE